MGKQSVIADRRQQTKLFLHRIIAAAILAVSLYGVLVARLAYLQVYQHHRYTTLAKQNQLDIIPLAPRRGVIYDRNGVLIAQSIPVFSLEVIPDRTKHLDKTLSALRSLISISDEEIQSFKRQLSQRRRYENVPLKLQLSEDEIARFSVNQHRFPGVFIQARLIRDYPLGRSLSHILGYVGRINRKELQTIDPTNYSATNFIGKIGVEKFYESALHGQVGYETVETDAGGRIVRSMNRVPPTPGNNLYLSIDSRLQIAAIEAMAGHRGSIVALDPRNGEILALVSTPTFEPNQFVRGIDSEAYRDLLNDPKQPMYNRAIRGQYPMASPIKPFLAIAGLHYGVISTRYSIHDPGWFQLPNSTHRYRDWARKGHGHVRVKRAIVISCDTFFYNLAYMLGIKRIAAMLNRFGFGQKTGVDIAGERPGLVPTPAWKYRTKGKSWYRGDTIAAGIGQGYVLTTPLQLASATAAIAMQGQRFQAHVLQKQQLPTQAFETYQPPALPTINLQSNSIWSLVIEAMQQVLTVGTGRRYFRKTPYTVAGKTGTAQVYSIKQDEEAKKKDELPEHLRDHSLFIAFAPVDNPIIAIATIVEHSHKRAGTVTREVLDYYLVHNQAHKVNKAPMTQKGAKRQAT